MSSNKKQETNPTDPTAKYKELLQRLHQQIESPRFDHIAEQNRVLEGLSGIAHELPATHLHQLLTKISLRLGITEDRTAVLIRLPTQERRRALRAQPITLDRKPGEELYPVDGWLGQYLLYCQESEAPLGFQFWSAIALLSAVARRNLYWDRGNYFLYLNHYLVLLGRSGLRKSTAIKTAVDMVEATNHTLHMLGAADELFVSPQRVTPEKLMEILTARRGYDASKLLQGEKVVRQRDAVGLIVSDELVTLLGRSVKGSDRMIHFLTDIYGGARRYEAATVTHGDRILMNVALSCLFASTEEWIRMAVTEDLFTGGFMARVVTVHRTEKTRVFPQAVPLDPCLRQVLADALVPWAQLSHPLELVRTPEADEWFQKWYHDAQRQSVADPKMQGYAERRDDHLHKLAGALRLSQMISEGPPGNQDSVDVTLEDFHLALTILEDEEQRYPEAFAEIGSSDDNRDAEKVMFIVRQWVETHGEPIPQHQLLRRSRFHSRRLRYLVEGLVAEQRLEIVPTDPGPGRTGLCYRPFSS